LTALKSADSRMLAYQDKHNRERCCPDHCLYLPTTLHFTVDRHSRTTQIKHLSGGLARFFLFTLLIEVSRTWLVGRARCNSQTILYGLASRSDNSER
jgi:VanZ family protein